MAPKVSVIIPVYNTEKYLEACVTSLTEQTLEEIEIILIDDGSKEPCALMCDELAKNDPRIKVIHKENSGQGIARNFGIEIAAGEYIGFVDSDDYTDTQMYKSLYEAAKRTDADLVLSGVTFVGGNTFSSNGENEEKHYFESDTVFDRDDVKTLMLGTVGALPHEPDDSRYGVGVWKGLFRRSLMMEKNIRFLSERKVMSEDTLFMVDFIRHTKKAVGIHGAYYRYRRNDQSFSKAYKVDRFEKAQVFFKTLEDNIKATLTKDEYGLYLDRLIQSYGRTICSQEIMHAKDENIPYADLRKRLNEICSHKVISDSLKNYPWYKLPKKQAAFAFAMKYKLYLAQKIMVTLRAK